MSLLLLWFPFLGFICGILFGRWLGKGLVFFTILNIFFSFLVSFYLFNKLFLSNDIFYLVINLWIQVENLTVNWEILLDSLNISMACIVTFISMLVHIYSSEYMQEDPHLQRFMSYLSLFTFFMMILITGGNYIQMFVGWEGVGLSSYLLINFWYTRLQANKSAIKAMLFNRMADFMLLIAICSIYMIFETFDYIIIFSVASLLTETKISLGIFDLYIMDLVCIFLFLGAMGKSAQLGFHNWLPDAMEGPTPVSALIHAATMVTAGIFLLIRSSYLFELSPNALHFVAIVGALTALFGSSVGLYTHDLKRVIAFSTCSQLGYMMLACGLEQYNVALFHLITHAFFKALLFLAAGSIIHSVFDEQDTRKLGGLLKFLPLTYICFLIGSLNLMGIPFLSGFYTKDMILELAFCNYSMYGLFCYALGTVSVFFTAAYSTRVLILIFLKNSNSNKFYIQTTHENNIAIKLPLVILSFLSIALGAITANIFYGAGTTFYSSAIFFNINNFIGVDVEFLSGYIKSIPLLFTVMGTILSFVTYMCKKKKFLHFKQTTYFLQIYSFFLKKWYTDRTINQLFSIPLLIWSQKYTYQKLDRGLLEVYGPTNLVRITDELLLKDLKNSKFYFNYYF
jgi:NADH-ubiquinone oxidoreductase chain 5